MSATQLSFDFAALGFEPDQDAFLYDCIDGREGVHRVTPCGHCEYCGKPMFRHIMAELANACKGHEVAA